MKAGIKDNHGRSCSREERILLESAKIASSEAISTSFALGLTIKVIKDNKIIAIKPDGSEVVIRTLEKHKMDTSKYKKGMILVRK